LESLKKTWIYGLSSYHGNWQVGFHLGFWRGHPDPGVVYAGGYICFNLQRSEAEARALSSAADNLKEFDAWERYWPNETVETLSTKGAGDFRNQELLDFLFLMVRKDRFCEGILGKFEHTLHIALCELEKRLPLHTA
jgi:hypothetical protein